MSQAAHTLHDEDPTLASLAPAADGTPALIAGRYEVRDSIGRGAFGEVFEAYDRVLGRLVAVKVMPIAHNLGAEGRESLRRFQVEARAVSRLTHPNIITVHDFGQGERFAWIVMELVIGETLADALRRTGPPPLHETSRILCALLSALHAAHERGIVHRDVKPGNILLEMNLEDGLGEVRLSDFGIARTEAEDRTAVGQMIGTPWVMAPEQLRGEAVDRRTDLWAAGVILYDMLTGERPFKGTMPGIFHRIQHEEPPPPTRLRAELPPTVDALIARALAKAPQDRFATAEEMAAAIRTALAEAPRWQDAPPLPGLEAEEPVAGTLVPAPPPPLPAPPAAPRSRFGQGLAIGVVAGIALGVTGARVAEMTAAVALQAGPPAAAPGVATASLAPAPDAPATEAEPRPAAAWMPEPAEAIRPTASTGTTAGATAIPSAPAPAASQDERATADTPAEPPAGGASTVEAGTYAAQTVQAATPAPPEPATQTPLTEASHPPPADAQAHTRTPHGGTPLGGMSPGAAADAPPGPRPDAGIAHGEATTNPAATIREAPALDPAAPQPRPATPDTGGTPQVASQPVVETTRAVEPTPASAVTPHTHATAPATAAPATAAPATAAPATAAPPSATQPAPVSAETPQREALVVVPFPHAAARHTAPSSDTTPTAASPSLPAAAVVRPASGTTPPSGALASTPATTLPACAPDRLRIRTGSHDGHGRIVFDWSGPVAYRLTHGAEGLAIAFPDAGCQPTTTGIRTARNLQGIAAPGQGTSVVLRIAPGTQTRDFRLGNRIVIDLADTAR